MRRVARPSPRRDLILFDNGLGGFTPDGREYVITTAPGQATPAPWVNVLANPHFGTVVSESGAAYTWSENAHEFRLTPWHNDPVSDASGEAFYLRDEESGQFWSPTPLPGARRRRPTSCRHGFGYSVFEHTEDGIGSELWVYVALDAPVKFSVLKVRNDSGRPRRLSATGYVEWVLGDLRPKIGHARASPRSIPTSGALFARNPYNTEFADRVAFFDVDDPTRTLTGDRTEFLGRNGTLAQSGRADAHAPLRQGRARGWIPAPRSRSRFELADGQEREIVFRLGVGRGRRRRQQPGAALPRRRRRARRARSGVAVLEPHARRGPGRDARPVAQRAGQRLAGLPDPGLPPLGAQRLLPVGRRLRLPRPVAGRDGAGPRRARRCCASICCAAPAASSAKATCSTGGIRRRAAACARTSRTTTSGCRWRLPLRLGAPATPACWTKPCRSSTAARSTPEEESYYDLPGRSDESASLYEHCVRAI